MDSTVVVSDIAARLAQIFRAPGPESLVEVAAAHNALRQLQITEPTSAYARCLLEISQFFYLSGHSSLAMEPAIRSTEIARAAGDNAILRRAVMTQGVISADTGNWAAAIESYMGAVDLASAAADKVGEASVWTNIGAALIAAGNHVDAIAACHRALQLLDPRSDNPPDQDRLGLGPTRGSAYTNIALACLNSEQFDFGISAARMAIEQMQSPSGAHALLDRAIAEAHFARLLLETGQVDQARERVQSAKDFAEASQLPRAQQVVAVAEGLADVFAGDSATGLARLQATLQAQRALKASLQDVLLALVRACEFVGDHRGVLLHLRELLHLTARRQKETVLAQHRLHLRLTSVSVVPQDAMHRTP
jgi:tetratricopeptide (TPR) repeat protein